MMQGVLEVLSSPFLEGWIDWIDPGRPSQVTMTPPGRAADGIPARLPSLAQAPGCCKDCTDPGAKESLQKVPGRWSKNPRWDPNSNNNNNIYIIIYNNTNNDNHNEPETTWNHMKPSPSSVFFVTNMCQLPLVKSQDIDQVPQASAKALFRRQRLEKPAPCPH